MLIGMRVLIIGASGYLGSEIQRQAADAGHDVAGTQFSAGQQGLRRLDIRDAEAVAGVITGFDAVINAAYDKGSCDCGRAGAPRRVLRASRCAAGPHQLGRGIQRRP